MIIERIKKVYTVELFNPRFWGIFMNPFYIIRKRLRKSILKYSQYMTGTMLDFGCGDRPYADIFKNVNSLGLDTCFSVHDGVKESADVIYDGNKLPFKDESFDSAFSSEVFEHIFDIQEMLQEIKRVLKPGSHFLLTVPFVWDEHEVPYDCARYTLYGLENLLVQCGFEVVIKEKTGNYLDVIFQLWCAFLYQRVFPDNRFLKLFLNIIFVMPTTVLCLLLTAIFRVDDSLYLNNVIVAKRV